MKYKIEINEEERNLLLQDLTEMMMDKEFYDRELAGQLFYRVIYAERTGGECENECESKCNNTSI